MVFSSHLFFYYFLPIALIVYFGVPRRARHLALTALSYLFYGWANPLFVVLLLGSTIVDYVCGLVIAGVWGQGSLAGADDPPRLPLDEPRTRRQRTALTVSIVTNLSLLGFFKYFNFGIDSWNALAASLGADMGIDSVLRVTLPLGISFYTFQSMSYSIDVYRGHARALRNPIDFACYVSMFPQLVAGPIIRFAEVSEQLRQRRHTLEKAGRGAAMLSLGMAKKILIANPCGKVADLAFGAHSLDALDAWYGVTSYAFQIYFDFSGYSDMAIGLGLMLGFVFPKNFDSPYRSRSVTEFWRRWHISLSGWLRDYLYVPLGGNRRGAARTYLNLAIVMLLGGLWHGAAWTFVAWGGIHGGMLALERWRGRGLFARWPAPLRVASTFVLVLLAWVFFRSDGIEHAGRYLAAMFGLADVRPEAALLAGIVYKPYYLGTFLLAAIIVWSAPQSWEFTRRLSLARACACLMLLWLALVAMATQSYNPFIYFIF